MLDTTIKVKTDTFDGPLALLLLLIQKEEMSIRDLNLTKITKQYLDYLSDMDNLNFDIAGDYLFLASILVLLKSKNVIALETSDNLKKELDIDGDLNILGHTQLIQRLEELEHFQKMSQKLWALPRKGEDIFVRPRMNRKKIINSILLPMDLEKLTNTMIHFIFKGNRKYTVIKRDRISIKEKLQFLKSYLKIGERMNLKELIEKGGGSRIDNIVITFISILELSRLRRINIYQNNDFEEIYIDTIKSLESFDIERADGFELEDKNKKMRLEVPLEEKLSSNNQEIIEESIF